MTRSGDWRRWAIAYAWSSFVLTLSALAAWGLLGSELLASCILGGAIGSWILSRLAWARRSGGTSPYSAFAIVVRSGLVLAVSRKDDPSDLNLPGGKRDPGETGDACARRELREETGITSHRARLVYRGRDRHHEHVEAYVICDVNSNPVAREAGRVAWVRPADLIRGTYGGFNRRALRAAGLLGGAS